MGLGPGGLLQGASHKGPGRSRQYARGAQGPCANSCLRVCPLVCPFIPTLASPRFRHRTASATGARTLSDLERHRCRPMSESVVKRDGADKREVRGSTPRWPTGFKGSRCPAGQLLDGPSGSNIQPRNGLLPWRRLAFGVHARQGVSIGVSFELSLHRVHPPQAPQPPYLMRAPIQGGSGTPPGPYRLGLSRQSESPRLLRRLFWLNAPAESAA
jgi:hypothetical protein